MTSRRKARNSSAEFYRWWADYWKNQPNVIARTDTTEPGDES